ncbi:Octanoyltransferase, conserved site [Sesbania bispinosa]|nr:Octanoyltransferase, conserved site [Sesbania bispinosa]
MLGTGMRVLGRLEVWKLGVVNYLDALKTAGKAVGLGQIGAELHYTQRGGDITFHGPHQAILYPIVSLREMGLGARRFVEKLELTMIDLAGLYGVKACPGQSGETGVWVGERKIGAIGVRISNGITSHGIAFNIDPDLTYFRHIVPCGITDKE